MLTLRPSALFVSALSCAATVFASDRVVIVPLTDPSIVLTGNTRYNASVCGGAIYLPTVGDALYYQFNGSDIQLDTLVVSNTDMGNFTASPDEANILSADSTPWDNPPSLDCSVRESSSFSLFGGYQLKLGVHTLEYKNIGRSTGGGGIFVVGMSYFPDPLPSTFSTGTPEDPQPVFREAKASSRVILAASVASVGGVFILLCLGEALRRRLRNKRRANNASVESVDMNILGSAEAAPNSQKQKS
ncbi:hypothetical protein FRC01_007700, partial [Tulasnella sp. 417]